jgi:hypothetical protein
MSLRVLFRFDVGEYSLDAPHLARLLLDLQHLIAVAVALSKDVIPLDDVALDLSMASYKRMIEAQPEELGQATATIARIRQESPLLVELLLKKLPKALIRPAATTFKFIFDRIFFGDIERERRMLANAITREEILRVRVETLGVALDVARKLPGRESRDQFMRGVISSIRPFEEEHPKILEAKVLDEQESEPN